MYPPIIKTFTYEDAILPISNATADTSVTTSTECNNPNKTNS